MKQRSFWLDEDVQAAINAAQSAWGERSSSSTAMAPSRGVQELWSGKGKLGILLKSLLCNVRAALVRNPLCAKKRCVGSCEELERGKSLVKGHGASRPTPPALLPDPKTAVPERW